MADKTPWLAAEQGTYSGGSTLVTLSGSAVDLGGYPSRTFAQASADADTDFDVGDTVQVTVSEGADTWGVFAGVAFASTTVLDFGAATKLAGEGSLTNGGAVYVFAGQPPVNPSDYDAAGTAATGDAAHLSEFDHNNIPSTDQAAALDNNNSLNAGNPAASMADITLVGDDRYSQSTDDSVADIVTVTQAEYDALTPPDSATLYLICEATP